jgi:ribosome-binding protein aMBF1 (putative translation factor)
MPKRKDLVSELVEERTAQNPDFPALVDAASRRRELLRTLAADREATGLSQTAIAARMSTSQSAVARIESGQADVKLSTLERYAAAVGKRVQWELVDASS